MTKHPSFFKTVLLTAFILIPATFYSTPRLTPTPQSSNDVQISGSLSPDKIKKGRTVQGHVTMEIPGGLHVQSNKPLDKFLIATKLDIEAPREMKVGPITYPRALMRNLKFSKSKVAVFEGRAPIRFNLTVPANYAGGSTEIRGKLRFQACTDDACFPPVTREVKMWLNVE